MAEEQVNTLEETQKKSTWTSVTPFSKYLALALFVTLPFVGFWLGYKYAPEKVVEVEGVVERESELENSAEKVIEVERAAERGSEFEDSAELNNFESDEKKSISDVILHPECSEKNPPQITSNKTSGVLDFCGNKTEFSAREFKDEGFILFVETSIGEDGNEIRTLRTISIRPPFNEMVLGNLFDVELFLGRGNYVDDIFLKSLYADGPGSMEQIFIFKPSTKDYVIARTKSIFGYQRILVAGSVSKTGYFAEYDRWLVPVDLYHDKKDDDIQLTINETTFTKKEITEGKGDEYLKIFSCHFLGFFRIEEESEQYQQRLEEYLKYFPSKVPCYSYEIFRTNNLEPIGFIDLEKNEFVSVKKE